MTDNRQNPSSPDYITVLKLLENESDMTRRAEIMSELMEQRYAANPLKYEYQRC
jgi:hypothetical protein